MSEFPCYGFTPARRRMERAKLSPPLRHLENWPVSGAGYLPLAANGRLFFSLMEGAVVAHAESDARLHWRYQLPGRYMQVVDADGAILLDGDNLLVYCKNELRILSQASGETIDLQPVPRLRLQGGLIVDGLLLCYWFDHQVYLGAWDLRSRAARWKKPLPVMGGALAAADGCLVSHDDQLLSVHDLDTGREHWAATVAELGSYRDLFGETKPGMLCGVPTLLPGKVVAAVIGNTIVAFDLQGGRQLWVRRVDTTNPYTMTSYADERVYVLGQPYLHILDGDTGDLLARVDAGPAFDQTQTGGTFTTPAITDDYVYAGADTRSVIALHKERGTIDWTFQCRARLAAQDAPLVLGHRMYILDSKGNFYVFESET